MLFFAFMLLKKRTKLDSADLPLDTSKAFSAPLERYISLKPQTHNNTSKKNKRNGRDAKRDFSTNWPSKSFVCFNDHELQKTKNALVWSSLSSRGLLTGMLCFAIFVRTKKATLPEETTKNSHGTTLKILDKSFFFLPGNKVLFGHNKCALSWYNDADQQSELKAEFWILRRVLVALLSQSGSISKPRLSSFLCGKKHFIYISWLPFLMLVSHVWLCFLELLLQTWLVFMRTSYEWRLRTLIDLSQD